MAFANSRALILAYGVASFQPNRSSVVVISLPRDERSCSRRHGRRSSQKEINESGRGQRPPAQKPTDEAARERLTAKLCIGGQASTQIDNSRIDFAAFAQS